jgi:hypothetical protein
MDIQVGSNFMNQILTTLILCFTLSIVNGQKISQKSKNFILDFYRQKNNFSETTIFAKEINPNDKTSIIEMLQDNNAFKIWQEINDRLVVDSLILTAKEKQFIIKRLADQVDTTIWNEINIPNSLVIARDSILAILRDRNKGWDYFYTNYGNNVNSFTIPIFFRHNRLCAFYADVGCGELCGFGEFAIYRREKSNWVRWITLYAWIN